MKTVCKKLLSLLLVAMLLVSAVPFQASATEGDTAIDSVETNTAAVDPAAEAAPASVEGEVVAEDTASAPAAQAINDTCTINYYLKDAVGNPDALIKQVATKVGTRVSGVPDGNAVLTRYAQIFGSSTGKQFYRWVDKDGNQVNTNDLYVTDNNINTATMTLDLYAEVTNKAMNISLDAAGGKLSSSSYQVTIGQAYGALPTPTRDHYTFQYWYKTVNGVEEPVDGNTIVLDTSSLKAKWAQNTYNVNYQRYDLNSGWVDSGYGANVAANGTVSAANGTFPSDAQIASSFALDGYTIVGWEIGDTDTAFKAGNTRITSNMVVRPRYQRSVTLLAQNPITKTTWSSKTMTVEIGEPVGTMPNPGARDGYTFTGWWGGSNADQLISTKANLSNVSTHPNYDPKVHGTTFYAAWDPAATVYLYIHTDGNVQTYAKMTKYYEAPVDGEFDLSAINMYSIFPNYGNYDDNDDKAYGWYDATQWKNYCAGEPANEMDVYYNLEDNGLHEFHIMLINGGSYSSNSSSSGSTGGSYNNNSATADPSNPTTGDQIFMAVTVLALSAGALALIFFLNKKRKASN